MADEYVKGSDELQLTLLEWLKQGPQTLEVLLERLPHHTEVEIINAIANLRESGSKISLGVRRSHIFRLEK